MTVCCQAIEISVPKTNYNYTVYMYIYSFFFLPNY